MNGPLCDICQHEKTLGRCWRLTCPVNGGKGPAFALARPGPFHKDAKKERLL